MADETTTDIAFFNTVQDATLDWGGTSTGHRRVTQARQLILVYDIMVLDEGAGDLA